MKRQECMLLGRFYSAQSSLPVPVIKLPKYVYQHVEKNKRKDIRKEMSIKRKIIYRGNTSLPVISSTNGEFNHYLGQIYNPKYSLPLQSKYWFKPKSSGQKFTIHPYDLNPSLSSTTDFEYDDESLPMEFCKFNLSQQMLQNLKTVLNFERPTRIQTLAIPKVSEGHHIIMAAETGSGKTISYLAPIIDKISFIKKSSYLYHNTPLSLVITPGRELSEQVADIGYKLASKLDVNVKVLMSQGSLLEHLRPNQKLTTDVLVASIGSLTKLFKRNILNFGSLRYLVLEEADTLLDDSFIEDTKYFLSKMTLHSKFVKSNDGSFGAQLCCISSIYPSNITSIFSESFNERSFLKVCSPYLHRVQPHVEQRFIRVSNDTRAGELLELVKTEYDKNKPLMVFCNKSPTCDWLSVFLQTNGVPNVKYHGAVSPLKRSQVLRHFFGGLSNVLVCTDLASRGLDTQVVKHVINFDFPNNVSDYILRAGRVGRVGTNHGHVTSFVVSKSGVYTVQDIEKAVKQSTCISNVDSNIKGKINRLYFRH